MGLNPETTYPAIIGRIIAKIRKDKAIDQEEAARKADINRSSWSRIENGDSIPDAVQLANIAEALGTSPTEILEKADRARKELERQGVKVHMATAKSKKSSGIIALLGAAALGGLLLAANSKADKDKDD